MKTTSNSEIIINHIKKPGLALLVIVGLHFMFYLPSCDKETEYITETDTLTVRDTLNVSSACGCMDPAAVNYNANAECDNGSCILPSQLDGTTRTIYSAADHTADGSKAPWVDKAHSSVRWETSYSDLGFSLLTGRFAQFDVAMTFNEKDPSLTKIEAWVQLSSQITGEPGRDDPGKCGPGYHGVEFNTHEEYEDILDSLGAVIGIDTITVYDDPIEATDFAYLDITGAEFYFFSKNDWTTSYKATGTLDYQGATSSVDLFFNYNGLDVDAGRTGFEGYFEFNAKSDHGVTSTSVADRTTVRINVQVRGL